ncbi:GNAT family N-acetyltransferase [Sphingorhabdus sp. YGSMI21]|uniref:GNAT family N-acetyltransferase n=1 Tax=Sphingorhabdus sp. YGSMI21 TaxID=2077182 RepID=UPI000C1EBCDC|nr:GNAT family N-acetyltransferase [Sphingorhabdus sp. YGSMI21]ATW04664.1 GNAT family N-acetyltransferase [Sphingorhabdus sp. YGSMI21]
MALQDVPAGHVATIITHLEMLEKPVLPATGSGLELTSWPDPAVEDYRALFRKVGEPWMWISRLLMDESELKAIIEDPAVEISIIRDSEAPVGFIELDFRVAGQCEIAFFGLVPEMNGKGHGRWMMNQALNMAWRDGIERVWLHSCTQDSPRALPFYRQCGFRIFRQQTDIMEDPRLTGHLPESAAPHVPILK